MLTGEIPFDSNFFSEVAALWKNGVMILIALGFIFLAIYKGFEPLLLIPIGVGIMLAKRALRRPGRGARACWCCSNALGSAQSSFPAHVPGPRRAH